MFASCKRLCLRGGRLAGRLGVASAVIGAALGGAHFVRAAPRKLEMRDLVSSSYDLPDQEIGSEAKLSGDQDLFNTIVSRQKQGKDTVVEIHMRGCMACAALHPKFRLLSQTVQDHYGDSVALYQTVNAPSQIDTNATPMVVLFPGGGTLQDARSLRLLETEADEFGVQRAGLRTVPEMLAFVATNGRGAGVNSIPDLSVVKAAINAEQESRRYHNVLHSCELAQWVLASAFGAPSPEDLDSLTDIGDGTDALLDAYRAVQTAAVTLKETGIVAGKLRRSTAPCIAALLQAVEALSDLEEAEEEDDIQMRLNALAGIRFGLSWFAEPGNSSYAGTARHRRVDPEQYVREIPAATDEATLRESPRAVLPLGLAHDGGVVTKDDCLGGPMGLVELALDAAELHVMSRIMEGR